METSEYLLIKKKMGFELNCRVEVDGQEGTVVRTNVFGIKKSQGVAVEFDNGVRKLFIDKQMECIAECNH